MSDFSDTFGGCFFVGASEKDRALGGTQLGEFVSTDASSQNSTGMGDSLCRTISFWSGVIQMRPTSKVDHQQCWYIALHMSSYLSQSPQHVCEIKTTGIWIICGNANRIIPQPLMVI